jgi:FKBP-type peptidyl-prolyl cis-trans isomerase
MQRLKLFSITAILILSGCDNNHDQESVTVPLDNHAQKISYLLGMDSGQNIQSMDIEFDTNAYQQGLTDGFTDRDARLTEEQIAETIQQFRTLMIAKQEQMQKAEQEARELQSTANLKEGAAFLEQNANKDGVVTTESGLQYKVLVQGEGSIPTENSTVEVHYVGRFLDGTEFDSSIKRGVPAQFSTTQVIAGWTEALKLMTEGSKWELYIPPELAYGPGGTGSIGPNAVLVVEVELLQANVKTEK